LTNLKFCQSWYSEIYLIICLTSPANTLENNLI
jgi:hypothetical protein